MPSSPITSHASPLLPYSPDLVWGLGARSLRKAAGAATGSEGSSQSRACKCPSVMAASPGTRTWACDRCALTHAPLLPMGLRLFTHRLPRGHTTSPSRRTPSTLRGGRNSPRSHEARSLGPGTQMTSARSKRVARGLRPWSLPTTGPFTQRAAAVQGLRGGGTLST